MITLQACRSKREYQQFEHVAEDLHGADAAFVPPFPGSVAKFLDPACPFQKRHGEVHGFIARRDGRAVGRIAAIINRTHNQRYNDRTGFFGFFECENDPTTAAALLDAAAELLRDRGFQTVRGPYNPSINDECGLLVEGHHIRPFMGLTWNPAFYESLLTAWGLVAVRELYGYELPLHRLEAPERLRRIVERAAKRSGIILRPIKLDRIAKEMEIVQEIYNDTLERNWGFTPISMDDLLSAADDMRQIADPKMILIAEMNGENAGVAVSLPNINEFLARTKTTPRPLRWLHMAWLVKTRRPSSARQVIYGISPRFRDKGGLHAWLLHEQFCKAKEGYHDAELGWIEETNTEIASNATMIGGIRHKTWRLYERSL